MSLSIVERVGDVKIYGNGSLGGKGDGLVRVNECKIPGAHKIPTRVLTTVFYDRFLEQGNRLKDEETGLVADILRKMDGSPISVRSSATNEGILSEEGPGVLHAGENTSFMLPNNHPNYDIRLQQLTRAIENIYKDFKDRGSFESGEKMAIVINPIPGVHSDSAAGPIYYPLISGVANSFFPYALKSQDPNDGFARLAFGHGYATVLDDFPVIPMATIKKPLPLRFMGEGQMMFYSIDMTKNEGLLGEEFDTMRKLHINFGNKQDYHSLGFKKNRITLEPLIQNDHLKFKTGLSSIMETISDRISSNFQIEFVFNIDQSDRSNQQGIFHIVQLTRLPEFKFEKIDFPVNAKQIYLDINSLQGHGVRTGIRYAVVVSPFIYSHDLHEDVRFGINKFNAQMKADGNRYILIVPGRLGSSNRDWGIKVDYEDVDMAAAIFEYGVDIAGRAEPVREADDGTGGVYGSHFLYMIQGGHDEYEKRLRTRMYGTQGTHFLTNLMGNNLIYGFIAPAQDKVAPWFFTPESNDQAVYILRFENPVDIYADCNQQRCMIISEF
jgi:hypothetical protein